MTDVDYELFAIRYATRDARRAGMYAAASVVVSLLAASGGFILARELIAMRARA